MDHPLENLDPERFQQLCQSLLVQELPGTSCFPVGQPDGGRDAIRYGDKEESTRAFAAFQVKFSRSNQAGEDARAWILAAAKDEAKKVARLKKRGANKYFLITNVAGTAHLDVGSIDKLHAELSNLLGIDVSCWWRDDINRRLDSSWDIKLRYPEVLTGQDFLRLLMQTTQGDHQERRLNALKAFLVAQHLEDQEVKFKQVELQNKLLDLFVDLPFSIQIPLKEDRSYPEISPTIKIPLRPTSYGDGIVFEDASEDAEKSGTASLLLSDSRDSWLQQVVVEGAPGQGKSTLVQYVCQVYRICLLNRTEELESLPTSHRHSAVHLPFKIDLRDLSEWLAGNDPFSTSSNQSADGGERTLETFIARLVRNKAGGIDFTVNDFLALGKVTPLFIALDGLDEVADIKRRADVVSAVTKALPRIRENAADLRVVITSRPAAFANSPGFDTRQFSSLQLRSVTKSQIAKYAGKWMSSRGLSSSERGEFEKILGEKLDQPHLRDLSRNPMQLTILLSLIHTRGPALPDKRTTLYDSYVDLFFSRESIKNPVVRTNLELLKDIHRYLAWVLHSSAESTHGSSSAGRLTSAQLRETLHDYLKREGRDTSVVNEIFSVLLERVVMIVSRVEGTYEFEVQPLREYFAARYLYDTASYSPPGGERSGTKPDRFDAIAKNFYWLNVTRFFCGCFSKGELLDLADRVKSNVSNNLLNRTRHPITLGAMLLSDWVFAQSPKATSELASMLSTKEALRRLSAAGMYGSNEDTVRIPKGCGGSEIARNVFEWMLEHPIPYDWSMQLARFLTANVSSDEVLSVWLERSPKPSESADRWLRLGRQLNLISIGYADVLAKRISELPISDTVLSIFWNANCESLLPRRLEVYSRLCGILKYLPQNADHAVSDNFFLVPALLGYVNGLGRYSYQRQPEDTLELVEKFRSDYVDRSSKQAFMDELSISCFEISLEVALKLQSEEDRLETAELWESFVDQCAARIGIFPSIVAAAVTLASLPRSLKRGTVHRNLLDNEKSLCLRLRFARRQNKNWEWWKEQLDSVKAEDERFLWLLCLWAWFPIKHLIHHLVVVDEVLNVLSDIEWNRFVAVIEIPAYRFSSSISNVQFDPKSIPINRSLRLAYFLSKRCTPRQERRIFLAHFVELSDTSSYIAKFRLTQAYESAAAGELPWTRALEIFRECYKRGAMYSMHIRKKLPTSVVDTVLASPDDYPALLWHKAEEALAQSARRFVRPVWRVASKEKWFAE